MKPYFVLLIVLCCGLPAIAQPAKLLRGPYLQTVTPTGITIRWRTDLATTSVVRFGTTAGQLTQTATDNVATTEHVVILKGLSPATRVYYTIGSSTGDLMAPSSDQSFLTAPATGSTKPIRLWVLGDFGTGSDRQRNAFNAFLQATQNKPPDAWVWLGDNAYSYGYDDEYQKWVYDYYPSQLKTLPFWPTPGNHDYHDDNNDFNTSYYAMMTTPQQGEAGGIPSNSKSYYSTDYGQVHLISLDSFGNEDGQTRLFDTTGRQIQWLKRDLAANKQPWTIVFFHHPPYTKGSRNSDTEADLVNIRQTVTPILERYNVDMVLSGHSHLYERSYLMRGHLGQASTFSKAMHAVDTTTGRYDGSANSCPIIRKNEGIVYIVNGGGGASNRPNPDFPHPAMVYANNDFGGSMLLDVTENRLDGQWIAEDGVVRDQFTIVKNVNKKQSLTIKPGETGTLTASWPGQYRWSNGQTARTISATTGGTYTVTDGQNCLRDEFTVTVPIPTTAVITTSQLASNTICAGATASVAFSTSNVTPSAAIVYAVQLSDAQGSFVSGQTLGSGTTSPISVVLPGTLTHGSNYALRVVASAGISGAVVVKPGPAFTVRALPTATLGGSLTIIKGENAPVSVTLTGDNPWAGVLSDGTTFLASSSPAVISVKPSQTTTFQVSSVQNQCGPGTVSGSVMVTVQLPTGVETFRGGQFSVYPNPSSGRVTVQLSLLETGDADLRLTDSRGALIWQRQLSHILQHEEEITLPAGSPVYFLTVHTDGQTMTRKIIRQ